MGNGLRGGLQAGRRRRGHLCGNGFLRNLTAPRDMHPDCGMGYPQVAMGAQ